MSGKYHRPMPGGWFMKRPGYFKFMVRELTAVFIFIYMVTLLSFLAALGQGPEAFAEWLHVMNSPGYMLLHLLVLIAAVWHSITWHNLTPKAQPLFIGEKKVPGVLIAIGMGYAPWIVVSIIVMMLVCP